MSGEEDISVILGASIAANDEESVDTKAADSFNKELTQTEFLIKIFNLLDVKLNLYFTSHSASADLDKLLLEMSRIIHKALKIGTVLQILYLYPGSFKVYETTNGRYLINLPASRLNGMEERKKEFERLLQEWTSRNGDEIVPCATIDEKMVNDLLNNKIRVLKNSNKRLKNNALDFEFKEKVPQEDEGKSLTLLQRIKLKEKLQKKNVVQEPVDSKLESIYNILYSLRIANRTNNYTLKHLVQKIKDSYKTSIHEDDVLSSLSKLSDLITAISIVEVNGLKVVKIEDLDRESDLATIRALYDDV